MIKAPYPWPTPPPTPLPSGFRTKPYQCHNCASEEATLGVGTWMMDDYNYKSPNNLVLCKKCFNKLAHEMGRRDYVQSFWTRLKILFTGKIK